MAQVMAPHGTLGDVQLLAAVHPVMPAVQTPLWGSRADTETAAAGLDFPAAPPPASASISISATAQVESQGSAQGPALVQAQNQPPVPVSAQAAAMFQTPASTVPKTSVPVQAPTAVQPPASAPVQAPVSGSGSILEPTIVSSVISDTPSAVGKPQLLVPGLVSGLVPVSLAAPLQPAVPASPPPPVAAPALQTVGIQTVPVPECASLATTQQNLERTCASSTTQQEPCVEVGELQGFSHDVGSHNMTVF